MKNVGTPPPPKQQSTIDKSLKKLIKAESIFTVKILELEEVNEEDGGLIKR